MQSNAVEAVGETESIHPIDPDLSVDEEVSSKDTENKNTQKPIPTGIKFMLAGVAILVLGSIAVASFMFSDDEYTPVVTNDAYVDPVDLANGKQMAKDMASSEVGVGKQDNELNDGMINQATALSSVELPSPISNSVSDETRENKETSSLAGDEIISIKSSINEQEIDLAQLSETIANLKQEDIEAIKKQLSALASDLESIKPVIKKHDVAIAVSRKTQAKNSHRQPSKPPFELVSIDVWGGQLSAVILMQNKTSFAQPGEVKAGWEIMKIERPGCITTKSMALNKTVKVCKKATI
mgnify:CR=1 FL=1